MAFLEALLGVLVVFGYFPVGFALETVIAIQKFIDTPAYLYSTYLATSPELTVRRGIFSNSFLAL